MSETDETQIELQGEAAVDAESRPRSLADRFERRIVMTVPDRHNPKLQKVMERVNADANFPLVLGAFLLRRTMRPHAGGPRRLQRAKELHKITTASANTSTTPRCTRSMPIAGA